MRILFVTPNSSGTGEAVTAMHMGHELARSGHDIRYFADRLTSHVLRSSSLGIIEEWSDDPRETRNRWCNLLRRFKPRVVVFADYPLLFLSRRGRSLLDEDRSPAVEALDAELVTLDHLGMAQRSLMLPAGPPHLELFGQPLPAVPERMRILLPCPIQSPTPVPGRRGLPFRYTEPPFEQIAEKRAHVRQRFLDRKEELMVFHSAPTWAQEFCRRHHLPNYSYLTRLLETFLRSLPQPVTLVSVNGGSLLPPSSAPGLRVLNLGRLAPGEYEELLFASDLMMTDNRVSVSLGKAVCATVPCVTLHNSYRLVDLLDCSEDPLRALLLEMERVRPGAVFPFEVFPIWSREDLDTLRLFVENPIEQCVVALEIYGGANTGSALRQLLTDSVCRQKLQARQHDYISLIRRLPGPEEALRSVL